MASNRDILISTLEALPSLAGRYESLKCVNYDATNGAKRGCFSLVFSAQDTLEGRKVALKFFDVDVAVLQDPYRIQAFEREPEILRALLGKERCLQLITGLNTYPLEIRHPDGSLLATIPCKYFVVEWVDEEIDDFFDRQDQYSPAEKLKLFNEILLGVEALHRHEIQHRDLKQDNLRAYTDALNRIVVAIDLGTAARLISQPLAVDYAQPVGASAYSAPETFCGLAGDRKIGRATDIYALGCLLYELFNVELFAYAVRRTTGYNAVLAAMSLDLLRKDATARPDTWRTNMRRFSRSIAAVQVDGPGSSAPPCLRSLLNDLIERMTHFDFQKRTLDLETLRRYVWSGLRILQNEDKYRRRMEHRDRVRQIRLDKIRRKEARLNAYLTRAISPPC